MERGMERGMDEWLVGWMDGLRGGGIEGWRMWRDRSMKEYAMKSVGMFGASLAILPPMDGIDRMSTSLPNMDSID